MPEVRILVLDDNPTADVFRQLLGVNLDVDAFKSGEVDAFKSGELVSVECDLFGGVVTLHIQWLEGKLVSRLLRKIPDAFSAEQWDLILIDDNWGADGDTAGQDKVLPCCVEYAKGEPMFVLFTEHWSQPTRRRNFGRRLSTVGALKRGATVLRRVWGMGKSDEATFELMLQRVLAEKKLRANIEQVRAQLHVHGEDDGAEEVRGDMIGDSAPMLTVYRKLAKYSKSDATALILGESGVGKELFARTLHNASARQDKPFVPINCGAMSETLLESELFGHEKGAFTGAIKRRSGKFELANGGTLMLDEVGEMTPATQVKLLRVLEDRKFERVGGEQTISVDVRVIAATNANLYKNMKDGLFRPDLYYRLDVLDCTIPALRDRHGDVRLLAESIVQNLSVSSGRERTISQDALALLDSYHWPGNVRQLRNMIEQALVLCAGDQIEPHDLQFPDDRLRVRDDEVQESPNSGELSARDLGQAKDWLDEIETAAQAVIRNHEKLTNTNIAAQLPVPEGQETMTQQAVSHRIRTKAEEMREHLNANPSRWLTIRNLTSIRRILNNAE